MISWSHLWRLCWLLPLWLALPAVAQEDFIEESGRKVANEAELRAIVAAPLPQGALYQELTAYYERREAAALQLGLHELALKNAKEWYDAMPEGELRHIPRWHLWSLNKNYGDRALAFKYAEEVVALAHGNYDIFLSRFQLARDYIDQFQIAKARELVDAGEKALTAALRKQPSVTAQFQGVRGKVDLLTLRSSLAMFDGKLDEAERFALASLEAGREAAGFAPRLDIRRQQAAYRAYLDSMNATRKVYLALGKTAEAELLLRETIDYLRAENRLERFYPGLTRFAAHVRIAQGRFADALALADAGLRALTADRSVISAQVVWSRMTRLYALIGLQRWTDALDETRRLEADTASSPSLRKLMQSTPRGVAYLKSGKYVEAERLLKHALSFHQERYGDGHYYTAQTRGLHGAALLAIARAARSATDEVARQQLKTAVDDMAAERGVSGGSIEAGMRGIYRRIVREAYLDALHPAMRDGDAAAIAEGFRIADTLRGASVQQAVVDAAVRSAANVPGLADLIRQLQDGQREIANLYDYIARQMGEPPERRTPGVVEQMRERLQVLEKQRKELLEKIRERFPEFDQLTHPAMPNPATVMQRLAPRESVLAILVSEERTYLWLVTAESVRFAAVPVGNAEIARLVGQLRKTLDVAGEEKLPVVDAAAAHALYRHLIEPVRLAIGSRDQLSVAVGGELASLPFASLLTRPGKAKPEAAPWLVRDMSLVAIPSVVAWVALRQLPANTAVRRPLLAFGDPDFGGGTGSTVGAIRRIAIKRSISSAAQDVTANLGTPQIDYQSIPPLPETRDELLAIAGALQADREHDLFFGSDASRATVMRLNSSGKMSDRQVVMFATHGLVPGDLPGLEQPALALAYAGKGLDGALLTLEDVLGLKLHADWVVLSACNTAAADGRSGEAISGLGRGFFFAGARSLLLTHWAVETTSAMALTTSTFANYARHPDLPRGEALRRAQLALLANPATAHPAFWAAFTLVGDGAR